MLYTKFMSIFPTTAFYLYGIYGWLVGWFVHRWNKWPQHEETATFVPIDLQEETFWCKISKRILKSLTSNKRSGNN